ncbi:STAS domain-containing protein [Blastococcus sp. SYSU D00695]
MDVPTGRVTVAGDLDHCTAPLLAGVAVPLAAGPARVWSVDAGAVDFCDGGGLTALLLLRDEASLNGRRLQLVAASRCVYRIIDLAGLGDQLPLVPAVPLRVV